MISKRILLMDKRGVMMDYKKITINGIRLSFIIWSILEVFKGNINGIAILMAGFILTFVPYYYTKWTKINIPVGACLLYDLFLFAAQFLGSYLGFYTYFSWWDMMLHLVSGLYVGYAGLILLITLDKSQTLFIKKKTSVITVFIFAIAVVGAVIWEIIEFSGDTFLGTNAQLGSLQDTMEDLICGTIVGGAFAIYVGIVLHKQCKSCVDQLLQINKSHIKHKK